MGKENDREYIWRFSIALSLPKTKSQEKAPLLGVLAFQISLAKGKAGGFEEGNKMRHLKRIFKIQGSKLSIKIENDMYVIKQGKKLYY